MEINVKEDKRIVEIWLTKEESRDAAIQESLKHLYRKWKEKRYLVAVFHSGTKDLVKATKGLLLYNRKRMVDMEISRLQKALTSPHS